MVDISSFSEHANQYLARIMQPEDWRDPVEMLREEMISYKLEPPSHIPFDRIFRMKAEGDGRNEQAGWAIVHRLDQMIVSVFGSWRGNPDRVSWCSRNFNRMDDEQRNYYNNRIREAEEKRELAKRALHEEAAQRALEIWAESSPASKDYPYIARKGISRIEGVRIYKNKLIVPVYNKSKLAGFEYIEPDGRKTSLYGTERKGGFYQFDGDVAKIYICEGWATGASLAEASPYAVVSAFGGGNLFEVANLLKNKYPDSRLIVAGDLGDVGRQKARQAAEGVGAICIFPPDDNSFEGKDFNDLHKEKGLEALKSYLAKVEIPVVFQEEKKSDDNVLLPPKGFLRDVYDYYNATSRNRQHGFAAQTALALGSVILGRRFKTNNGNYSSLFFLNIGRTGTGKEHSRSVITKIMDACGQNDMVLTGGYTSEGAVITALYKSPKHICVWDEFGKNLQAGKAAKDNNSLTCLSKLMEVITVCGGIVSSKTYSGAALGKDKIKTAGSISIRQPALTLLAMTTPSTFFEGGGQGMVADGFAGRFVTYISHAERELRRMVDDIEVPKSIIDWVIDANDRGETAKTQDNPELNVKPVIINIPESVYFHFQKFEQWCIDEGKKLEVEGKGLDDLLVRTAELALRISMICALSRNIKATEIQIEDIDWAVNYMRNCTTALLKEYKRKLSGSTFEADKLSALEAFRKLGEKGMTLTDLNKKHPFAKWKIKDRQEVLNALLESELIDTQIIDTGGRKKTIYYAKGE